MEFRGEELPGTEMRKAFRWGGWLVGLAREMPDSGSLGLVLVLVRSKVRSKVELID